MFNRDFLKKLTILYVEDEDITRVQLEKVLKRLFKTVLTAKNGLEGFEIYQEDKLTNSSIDLILSDINMPQLSGIDMLEKIRQHNDDIPIIFTTARSETEFLLKAISLNASYYALKPIDIEDVIEKIEKVCEKKYFESLVSQKSKELKEYITLVNSVSSIFKMDEEGVLTFTNSSFCNQLGYQKENLIGKNLMDLISSNIDKNLIKNLWDSINSDLTWKGDIKYETSENDIIYIKSTIFKVINDNKTEFISIGFSSTDDVNEKREFHKKIINNLKDKNLQVAKTQGDLKQYELIINNLNNEVEHYKQKYVDLSSQIHYYENEMLNLDQRVIKNLKIKNNEIEILKETISKIKHEKEVNLNNYNKVAKELLDAKIEIEKLYEKIQIKEKRVDDLINLVEIRESQLRKYDHSFDK